MIINISKFLPEPKNVVLFNPSIVYWKDNLYLLSYRRFFRSLDYYNHYLIDPYNNSNHPWYGGPESKTWWKANKGSDDTGLLLLEIIGMNVNVVKNFVNDIGYIEGADARLLKLNTDKNSFVISYNVWLNNRPDLMLKNDKCNKWCGLIAMKKIELTQSGSNDYSIKMSNESIVCPNISNQVEKNWSFWDFQNKLYFSYSISPRHMVVQLKDVKSCSLKTIQGDSKINFFERFEQYYQQNSGHQVVFTCLSTPAIPLYNSNRYIGVGHIKYKIDTIPFIPKDSNLYVFHNYLIRRGISFHPVYAYMMFFYEFDPYTYELTRVSDLFFPELDKWGLVFPSGLTSTHNENTLLVSYGDHDTECKLFTITIQKLNSMLYNINSIEPSSLNFIILSE